MSVRLITFSVANRTLLASKAKSLIGMMSISPSSNRTFSKHVVNKSFELISTDSFVPMGTNNTSKVFKDGSKPLVIMLTWLLARKKHVGKYCDIYLKKGFNIMTVSITPWQFFWPITGSQVVAEDLLKYLHNSANQQQLILHGFSIGAYLWGEVLVKMNSDLPKYANIIDRIKGQIWDSAADVTETTKGLPQAIFPRNAFLRSTMERYVSYHLKTFYDVATQHYVRSSQFFHTTPVRCPALFFVSKNDVIGSVIASMKARETWESVGLKTYWKCWEKSRHVSHLMYHREEYLEALNDFLIAIRSDEISHDKIEAKI
ncbi:uncharacterized protein LOC106671561 [Cimex lectularius]|uniref:Uncharacterized protein n=1 Tax=Cimex lectularius TaxID=79782 RepID=A0A8I6S3L5_CIMLE|nr:uncharacterized protein LOC106671561 [Cimex lectularius]XP_014257967.1 uncharacterized protein LOC106671561 [Cimex lectularius]XP_014257972.1 uncharacterized protein LOC106671561 [Cimex lectularius]XP_014257977.1 uncharacterized protein LOC106671561 [Cimex lectularius]XP_024080723.1 uncharacterized protein LOC106671561 [Cimex lectularius]